MLTPSAFHRAPPRPPPMEISPRESNFAFFSNRPTLVSPLPRSPPIVPGNPKPYPENRSAARMHPFREEMMPSSSLRHVKSGEIYFPEKSAFFSPNCGCFATVFRVAGRIRSDVSSVPTSRAVAYFTFGPAYRSYGT